MGPDGNYYILCDIQNNGYAIKVFDPQGNYLRRWLLPVENGKENFYYYGSLVFDLNENLWVGTSDGGHVYSYDINGNQLFAHEQPEYNVTIGPSGQLVINDFSVNVSIAYPCGLEPHPTATLTATPVPSPICLKNDEEIVFPDQGDLIFGGGSVWALPNGNIMVLDNGSTRASEYRNDGLLLRRWTWETRIGDVVRADLPYGYVSLDTTGNQLKYFDANWERIRVYTYLMISFLIALLAPVCEIKLGIRVHWMIKILLGMLGLGLPFFFGLVTMAQIALPFHQEQTQSDCSQWRLEYQQCHHVNRLI